VIGPEEERDLIDLSRGVWQAVESLVEFVNASPKYWSSVANKASAFPEGLTMPPAIRIDVVRTAIGPKIVEVDPITAISLGETVFLTQAWQQAGYRVVDGLLERIATKAADDTLNMVLPREKQAYEAEVAYLAKSLRALGVKTVVDDNLNDGSLLLSGFMESSSLRKFINKKPQVLGERNPLYGSLCGISDKGNLSVLRALEKKLLPLYLPKEYDQEALRQLDPNTLVVSKPRAGTGSIGVRAVRPAQAMSQTGNDIFQELLQPVLDNYGRCMGGNGRELVATDWVTRLSIYASSKGMVGIQATARLREGEFTNVHGQADAVQTTAAIEN